MRKKKNLHVTRRLYAAHALRKNPLGTASSLGHERLETTLKYYAPGPLTEALSRLWRSVLPNVRRPTQMTFFELL